MAKKEIPSTEFNEEQGKPDFSDDFSDSDKIQSNFFKFEKENDSIIGVLKAIEKGQFGDQYVLTTESDEVTVGGYTALASKINSSMVGKKLKIVYLGEKKAEKGGRFYKNFDVFVK